MTNKNKTIQVNKIMQIMEQRRLNEIAPLLGLGGGLALSLGVGALGVHYGNKKKEENIKKFPENSRIVSSKYGSGYINQHGYDFYSKGDDGAPRHVGKDGHHTHIVWDRYQDSYIPTEELHRHVKAI